MAHLLFVTSSLQHGGAERHTITLLNRLGERGHDVHLAYVKEGSSQLGRLRLPAKSTVRCLHAQRHLDWAAVAELARAIADLAPNVIVAANEYALLYATLARWRAGVRCEGAAQARTLPPVVLGGPLRRVRVRGATPPLAVARAVRAAQRNHLQRRERRRVRRPLVGRRAPRAPSRAPPRRLRLRDRHHRGVAAREEPRAARRCRGVAARA